LVIKKTTLQLHVYSGYMFILMSAFQNGFEFGWNINTVAHTLVILTIISGIFGIYSKIFFDVLINQDSFSIRIDEIFELITRLDDYMHAQAYNLDLPESLVQVIMESVRTTRADIIQTVDAGRWNCLLVRPGHCTTSNALKIMTNHHPDSDSAGVGIARAKNMILNKLELLEQVKRTIKIRYFLMAWQSFHRQLAFGSLTLCAIDMLDRFLLPVN
jgi:hypothetical protein